MHKVMTRTQHHPGTRPPGRRDTRRPAGTPPRTPSGGAPRTAPGGGRPPGPPGTISPTRTRPTDGRPETPQSLTQHPTPRRHSSTPAMATDAPTGSPTVPARTQTKTRTQTKPQTQTQTPRRPVSQPRPTDLFADRLLAVLTGRRPVHFMLRHTLGHAYDDLAHLAERGPLRATRGARPVVRDIGYYVPRPGAIEAFARIGAGDRLRAMAFRLELGTDHRWRCTAVELDGTRRPRPQDD
ncbi:Rv3235 family protein [Streptomyces sp. NBC_00015]|uniref:Rv3235 family protein n=1 Tax=unclassified Streptomyces TaxID=2593676 RepID=UPI002251EF08|nr:Rv3235 family protein [Streptomyces sp. NBC_00103]MCX5373423.1 Rv3235 family protein [Streptomyces sp. NBC_00103]